MCVYDAFHCSVLLTRSKRPKDWVWTLCERWTPHILSELQMSNLWKWQHSLPLCVQAWTSWCTFGLCEINYCLHCRTFSDLNMWPWYVSEKKSRGRHGAAVASTVGSQPPVSGSDSNFSVELARSTGACMSLHWVLAPTVQGRAS